MKKLLRGQLNDRAGNSCKYSRENRSVKCKRMREREGGRGEGGRKRGGRGIGLGYGERESCLIHSNINRRGWPKNDATASQPTLYSKADRRHIHGHINRPKDKPMPSSGRQTDQK